MQRERKPARDEIRPLLAAKRFGRYNPEEETAARKAVVEEIRIPPDFENVWRSMTLTNGKMLRAKGALDNADGVYLIAAEYARRLKCSPREVEAFAFRLAGFEEEKDFEFKAGLFLSALANEGNERAYRIPTSHFNMDISELGYRNAKELAICGDAGANAGERMVSGRLVVNGDAGVNPGKRMRGGLLLINGDCRWGIGMWMSGGEIHVQGKGRVCQGKHWGRIYLGGKLVFDKPDLKTEG